MKENIEELISGMKEMYSLSTGKTEIVYGEENENGLNLENVSKFDYVDNKLYLLNHENADFLDALDDLLEVYYVNNSVEGKKLAQFKKENLDLQSCVLKDFTKELAGNDNPIIIPYDGETKVFSDKHSIDTEIENYEDLLAVVNRPQYKLNDSIVLINKDVSLLKHYLDSAVSYNRHLNNISHLKDGFKLVVKENIYEDLETDFKKELSQSAEKNVNSVKVYKKLSEIEKEKGPLTALLHVGISPTISKEYLRNLVDENVSGYDLLLIADLEFGKPIYCLHENESTFSDKSVRLPKVPLVNILKEDFVKLLYSGEAEFNDLLLSGMELEGKVEFDKIKEDYSKHKFTSQQINGMKKRSLDLLNLAQERYKHSKRIESKLQNAPPVTRNKPLLDRLNQTRRGFLVESFKNCCESLRYFSFYGQYKSNNSPHIITSEMIERPGNKVEKLFSDTIEVLGKLRSNPRSLSSDGVFKMVYAVQGALLDEEKSFGKLVEEPSAETEKPLASLEHLEEIKIEESSAENNSIDDEFISEFIDDKK